MINQEIFAFGLGCITGYVVLSFVSFVAIAIMCKTAPIIDDAPPPPQEDVYQYGEYRRDDDGGEVVE